MRTEIRKRTKKICSPNQFCQSASSLETSSNFWSSAELTARILRTNITKLDILESDMIMRTVAAGLPGTP